MDTALLASDAVAPEASSVRVAWVFPSLEFGNYWHPVFSQFSQQFPHTKVFTGVWTGFAPGFDQQFAIETVGNTKFVKTQAQSDAYTPNVAFVSPAILGRLRAFQPDVIFVSGFSIWTLLVLLGKLLYHWRVVILYEGCSKTFDYRNNPRRLALRRWIVRWSDRLITNSKAGYNYLTEILHAPQQQVFVQPYEVPDAAALLGKSALPVPLPAQRPHFLFTGQLIPRKGLRDLIEACCLLKAWGYQDYTLTVVGDGVERETLQQLCRDRSLANVRWAGWVTYDQLGAYFQVADVFVLPTLEDTWGMVILEAMVFGKAVVCSSAAGAAELVNNGENGYVVSAENPQQLAERLRQFIQQPELAARMGQCAQQKIAPHTPASATTFLATVIQSVL